LKILNDIISSSQNTGASIAHNERIRELHWLDSVSPPISWQVYKGEVIKMREHAEKQKKSLNSVYSAMIPENVQLPSPFHSWRFQIRIPFKDKLIDKINQAGLFASGHYYPASKLFGDGRCIESELLFSTVVNLFNDFYFTLEKAKKTSTIVCKHLDTI
jgi:hypothetical protein